MHQVAAKRVDKIALPPRGATNVEDAGLALRVKKAHRIPKET